MFRQNKVLDGTGMISAANRKIILDGVTVLW
jgi:hypothetical protein